MRALPPGAGTAAVDLTTEVISNHLQREAVVIGERISSVRSTGTVRKYGTEIFLRILRSHMIFREPIDMPIDIRFSKNRNDPQYELEDTN